MPADANIFQAYLQPPKSVQDYQAAYDQADQRKNALQMAAMDLGERQQTLQRQQTVRNALMSLGATASDDERVNALRATATPEGYAQADALVKTQMERQKTAAQVGKDTAQAGHFTAQTADQVYKTRIAKSEQAIKDIAGFTSPQEALASLEAHAAAGDVDPQKAAMIRATIPQDPAQFPQWQLGMLRNIMAAKDQIAQVSPDANARLQAQTSTANNAATNATTQRGQDMTDKRFRELNAVGESTPENEQQLNYWADVIRKGGTLPPGLARGPGGSAFVREATKRAALGGTSPDEMMANQAEFAGAKAGQRTLGTKQANIEMAATEAYNMMPIAVAASEKVDRTQYPMLNKVLLAAEKGTGDTNVVQLSVAVNSLVNSYSRAISPSGTPTVSDKEHAREILDKAYAKGQFAAAVDVMKQEIEQARKSPAQVRAHMRPGAQPAADAAPKTVNFGDLK